MTYQDPISKPNHQPLKVINNMTMPTVRKQRLEFQDALEHVEAADDTQSKAMAEVTVEGKILGDYTWRRDVKIPYTPGLSAIASSLREKVVKGEVDGGVYAQSFDEAFAEIEAERGVKIPSEIRTRLRGLVL
jgi:hypothetical protein